MVSRFRYCFVSPKEMHSEFIGPDKEVIEAII